MEMTYIAQCSTQTHPPQVPTLFTTLERILLRWKAKFNIWNEQRKLLLALESMPVAMRKDLGWPAIDAERLPAADR